MIGTRNENLTEIISPDVRTLGLIYNVLWYWPIYQETSIKNYPILPVSISVSKILYTYAVL